jgi:pyridoxal-phosphate dependent TrpB-like enzyme
VLGTPAKIFYKYEGVSPSGSHKTNTSVPQAYYNKQAGFSRLTTETGAGQWGSALSFAGQMFGMTVRIYMVKISYEQKPYRRSMMQTWGGNVFPSPTDMTKAGRDALAKDPNNQGSLGLAISEAVEEAASRADTNYTLGSVLNHVLLHQTMIGLEAKKQLAKIGEYPDMVFAPCGGGSNFAGIAFPFLADKAAGKKVRLVGVEPTSCPSMTKGVYAYDYGDVSGYTPLMKMYTLGHNFMPPGIHAGGLRYHGESPLVSQLYHEKLIEAVAVPQVATFAAGVMFARPKASSRRRNPATASAPDRRGPALQGAGEPKTLLFCLSGHGHFDMASYDRYLSGQTGGLRLSGGTGAGSAEGPAEGGLAAEGRLNRHPHGQHRMQIPVTEQGGRDPAPVAVDQPHRQEFAAVERHRQVGWRNPRSGNVDRGAGLAEDAAFAALPRRHARQAGTLRGATARMRPLCREFLQRALEFGD